jgi:hypothetical protein
MLGQGGEQKPIKKATVKSPFKLCSSEQLNRSYLFLLGF